MAVMELIQMTAAYSNAVLIAILPHVTDVAKNLDLPILQPVQAAHVERFVCDPRKGSIGGWVTLTNGYKFWFLDERVDIMESPASALKKRKSMRNLIRVMVAITLIGAVAGYIKYARNQQAHLPKIQHPSCMNNLRQVGLALHIWAGDHGDQFPFNVPNSKGGTKEQAQADSEGFAVDPAVHFKPLGDPAESNTPLVLWCPKDHNKKPTTDWASLTSANITYKLRIRTNLTEHTKEVLVVCPIDGNTLYTDGTVKGEADPVKPGEPQPMRISQ